MSATVKIEILSPLGVVTVTQKAGRLADSGAEIEHMQLIGALKLAVAQVAAAFGIEPDDLLTDDSGGS